jgi:hypothetical protein
MIFRRQLILLLLLWDHVSILPSLRYSRSNSNSSNNKVDGQKTTMAKMRVQRYHGRTPTSSSSSLSNHLHNQDGSKQQQRQRIRQRMTFQGLQERLQLFLYQKQIQRIQKVSHSNSSALIMPPPFFPGRGSIKTCRGGQLKPRPSDDDADDDTRISIAPTLGSSISTPSDASPNYDSFLSSGTDHQSSPHASAVARGRQRQQRHRRPKNQKQTRTATLQVTANRGDDYQTIVTNALRQAERQVWHMIQNRQLDRNDLPKIMEILKRQAHLQALAWLTEMSDE